jgi:hypothetical protein
MKTRLKQATGDTTSHEEPMYYIGDEVDACWFDGIFYRGSIIEVNEHGKIDLPYYISLFDIFYLIHYFCASNIMLRDTTGTLVAAKPKK